MSDPIDDLRMSMLQQEARCKAARAARRRLRALVVALALAIGAYLAWRCKA